MRLAYIGSLVVVVALSTLPAHAHHSFGGTYNVDQKITIKGKIAQVTLRSPHSFLYVEVENGDGSVERWTIEGAAASQFAQQGIDKDAFKVGDPGRSDRQPLAQPERHTRATHQDHPYH